MMFFTLLASSADAATCLMDRWREALSVVVFAVLISLLCGLVRRSARKHMERRVKEVSFGGLFLATSLLLFILYLFAATIVHFVSGKSFEAFFFSLAGVGSIAPQMLGCLGSAGTDLWAGATPLYFPILYVSLHGIFILVLFLMLWGMVGFRRAFGPVNKNNDTKGPGKAGGFNETEAGLLAPVLGPVFQAFGCWADLRCIELRYEKYGKTLSIVLTFFKWICLPAAFLGTLPPSLWILAALVINNYKNNLKTPPAAEGEKKEQAKEGLKEEEEQKAVSVADVINAVRESESSFEIHSVGAEESSPAQLASSQLLSEGPAMALISEKLGFKNSLYAHQEACASHLRNRESVLLATAPLSGRTTIADLLALDRVLTFGESVLYICPTKSDAALRHETFKKIACKANWDWNLYYYDLANEGSKRLELQMRQPHVLFLTFEDLHEQLLPNARDWEFFLRSLGLVIALSIDLYTGAAGANLYRLSRRFARVVKRYGAEPLYFATAVPYSGDIRAFAERLLGVGLVYVGPGTDTAPGPGREILTCRPLPCTDNVVSAGDDIPVAVAIAGKVIGLGYRAELFGFENVLTRDEMDRLGEVLLEHGSAIFRSEKTGVAAGAGASAPGRKAEVVIARAGADSAGLMLELTRHFGADLVEVSKKLKTRGVLKSDSEPGAKGFSAMDTVLGLDRDMFEHSDGTTREKGSAHTSEAVSEKDAMEENSEEKNDFSEELFVDSEVLGETAPTEDVHFSEATAATIILPDEDVFVNLLLSRDLIGVENKHPYLRLGCESVTNPENEFARRKNLLCAMAEASWSRDELYYEFGRDLVNEELESMDADGRLLSSARREIDESTGAARVVEYLHYVGHPLPHKTTSMKNVTPDHLVVMDRHTRMELATVDRVRGLSDMYPGRVFHSGSRRYRVCNPEDQVGFDDGFIYADPHERRVVTAKIRELVFEPASMERRKRKRRREDRWPGYEEIRRSRMSSSDGSLSAEMGGKEDELQAADFRRGNDRRNALVHSIGGCEFMLWYPWVYLHEWVRGVKTYTRSGILLDATYYGSPIETRYRTRGAVLAFHNSKNTVSLEVLHSLTHVFRHVLPAFVRHDSFDMDISYMESFGPESLPAIAFLDRHPGDAGFARSVTTEVFKHLCYWSYRLVADCPAKCESPWGCYHCLRTTTCNASHGEEETRLDKESTLAILTELLGGFVR